MIEEDYPDIVDTISLTDVYKTVTDRYYTKRFCLNVNKIPHNNFCLLFHSNRICLLTLAPSHLFFKKAGAFKINFTPGQVDRTQNKVKGKGKKGGQKLEANTKLCSIDFDDGTAFLAISCMQGYLIEVNKRLIDNPQLLRERPDAEGYIAVILSKIEVADKLISKLMTEEEYSYERVDNKFT